MSWPIGADLVEVHELGGGVLLGLVERREEDVAGRFGRVRERTTDGVQVMGSYGNQGPLPGRTETKKSVKTPISQSEST